MTNIAILGFGVVGKGVADLIVNNSREVSALGGDEINIKYILDLRDFPDSPFADKIVHDFNVILSDDEIETVIEVMGGSHPAYEYTIAALGAGKNVITSNKEVVANFGDEFLLEAEKSGVCYRFEASVGGGIPIISPLISMIRHNKIKEVRGILNGTTNYILTKMFTFGDGFEESLKDAQERGYAERNPDADILGTDAARKIAILSALVTEKLPLVSQIHTEGITSIRAEDVRASEKIGREIKLLGRCINKDGGSYIMVAPFMIEKSEPLATVRGVYNAIEVIGEPIDRVMMYGPGAGAGPTASAVVGDLMQIMQSGRKAAIPVMERSEESALPFSDFSSRTYLALSGASKECILNVLGDAKVIENENELAFITEEMTERQLDEKLALLSESGARLLSKIRLL